jgi:hypothetical protein
MIGRAIAPNGSSRRASGSVLGLECRAIVPNGSARGASGGDLGFSAVALTGYGALRLRSIGDNRSTMALKRRRLSGFFFYKSHRSRTLETDAKNTIIVL